MARLILLNKPFGVLSQFTGGKDGADDTLAHLVKVPGVYPAGRLDKDSEGLLLLTDDGRLQSRIAEPRYKTAKTYLVQVEGVPDEGALEALRKGVMLKDGMTKPAKASAIDPPDVWERVPPIRVRKNVPDSWISLTISEGKNRQVRRMTAAVGFPTLRLVRWSVGDWTVEGLAAGEWRELQV
ncbi:MAG: pseudouridine synthase [Erythrobacter sp.]